MLELDKKRAHGEIYVSFLFAFGSGRWGQGVTTGAKYSSKFSLTLFCIRVVLGWAPSKLHISGVSPCLTFSPVIILSVQWNPCSTFLFSCCNHFAILFYLAMLSLQPLLTQGSDDASRCKVVIWHTAIITSLPCGGQCGFQWLEHSLQVQFQCKH